MKMTVTEETLEEEHKMSDEYGMLYKELDMVVDELQTRVTKMAIEQLGVNDITLDRNGLSNSIEEPIVTNVLLPLRTEVSVHLERLNLTVTEEG